VLAKLVLDAGVSWWLALPLALVMGAGVALGVEAGVMRRLYNRPRVVALVATIGVAQLLLVARALIPEVERVSAFPTPLDRGLQVGTLLLRSEHFLVLALTPAAVLALTLFLNRTPTGLAVRAAAENPDAATLAGMSPRAISSVVWAVAGALAALTVVLIAPLQGQQVGTLDSTALGAGLLLRALAAGLVGRLTSIPLALGGGVAIGAIEAYLLNRGVSPGVVELCLFGFVLVLVLLRPAPVSAESEARSAFDPTPAPSRRTPIWLHPQVIGAAALVGAVVLPLVVSSSSSIFLLTGMVGYALVGLSLVVLTGWAGQVSLGQFAIAGVGAFTVAALVGRGVALPAALIDGMVAGTLAALLIGLPALRVRGLFLTVTTLAFAVAAREWLFPSSLFSGSTGDATVDRTSYLGIDLGDDRIWYWASLALLALAAVGVSRLRRSAAGRALIAVRDNETRAASMGLSPAMVRLGAFALSGALAAPARIPPPSAAITFGPQDFRVEESFRVLAMVVIGGAGSVAGALAGAVYLIGVPALFGNTAVAVLLTSGLGILVLLLYLPGGLTSAARAASRALAARWAGDESDPVVAAVPPVRSAPRIEASEEEGPALAASGVVVDFGGRRALDEVDIQLARGEILGLIGANGAGKSTLLAVLGGELKPASGEVYLRGSDVSFLSAPERARAGLGRIFQNSRLYPELTVIETLLVAGHRHWPGELVPGILALPPDRKDEKERRAAAATAVARFGLSDYADRPVAFLSTGTRRVVELACLSVQSPSVWLLDEPTAGLAQKETEAFGPLLVETAREMGASVVLVEHDLPLVMEVSDRLQCLDVGRTIANGSPEEVRSDPAVLQSYLGARATT
jgi:ABC-type branched-subunit amino acid transport system ATPase component/ABC-type branched-subunit amino acid transport system permease subunit